MKERKAAKDHVCQVSGKAIAKGELYTNVSQKENNKIKNVKVCKDAMKSIYKLEKRTGESVNLLNVAVYRRSLSPLPRIWFSVNRVFKPNY